MWVPQGRAPWDLGKHKYASKLALQTSDRKYSEAIQAMGFTFKLGQKASEATFRLGNPSYRQREINECMSIRIPVGTLFEWNAWPLATRRC